MDDFALPEAAEIRLVQLHEDGRLCVALAKPQFCRVDPLAKQHKRCSVDQRGHQGSEKKVKR
jgi:hypothetical protein